MPPLFDPVAFGARLMELLESRSMTVKALQKEVVKAAPNVRGTSYGQVWTYVNGQASIEPRQEVVEAIASAVGVLPSYLLHGGPRTAAERTAQEVAGRREAPALDPNDITISPEDLERAFLEGLPELAEAGHASWEVVSELYGAWMASKQGIEATAAALRDGVAKRAKKKSKADHHDTQEKMRAMQYDAARRTTEMIGAAARVAGVDLRALSRWQLDRYIQTAAQACAMLLLMPHRLTGRPLAGIVTKDGLTTG